MAALTVVSVNTSSPDRVNISLENGSVIVMTRREYEINPVQVFQKLEVTIKKQESANPE